MRRSLWLGLATLICTLGYPGIVWLLFEPTGPGRHWMAVEAFVGGGIAVTVYFLVAAFITWAHRWRLPTSRRAAPRD